VILDMLEGMPFATAEVSSGTAAVDEIRRAAAAGQPYDVVYLDWRMPGMDGMETARRIQSLGLEAPPILLMVTAYGREEMLKEAAVAGIDDVLVKPVNASLLFDTTISVLGTQQRAGPPSQREAQPDDARARLRAVRGSRILLVEDNDINQQVARELLEDAGLVVELAADGQAALQMVQQAHYDLVFMDMQMPVMDGLAATREIRKIERLRQVPIVAMTANAMEQDRQKCIEAGMNDAVIKPIDPHHVWDALLRWIPQAPRARVAVPPKAQATAQQPASGAGTIEMLEGIAGLDSALGLRRMLGKKPLYLAMLRRYVIGQKNVCEQIHSALANGDIATAERLAHTTKAVSGNMGATGIQELAGSLEQSLKDYHPPADVQQRLADLEKPLAALIEALETRLPVEEALAAIS
jgi:two-component system sensor histidine kinase/response regulator